MPGNRLQWTLFVKKLHAGLISGSRLENCRLTGTHKSVYICKSIANFSHKGWQIWKADIMLTSLSPNPLLSRWGRWRITFIRKGFKMNQWITSISAYRKVCVFFLILFSVSFSVSFFYYLSSFSMCEDIYFSVMSE